MVEVTQRKTRRAEDVDELDIYDSTHIECYRSLVDFTDILGRVRLLSTSAVTLDQGYLSNILVKTFITFTVGQSQLSVAP